MSDPTQIDRLLNRAAVREMTSISGSQIDRLEKAGKFPKRIALTERRVAWIASEIATWVQNRIAANRRIEPFPA